MVWHWGQENSSTRAPPHLCLGRAASASASYGLTLWAESGGHCWGCSHIGLAPILQPFKLFVLQELFALQVPSLCPWGGAGLRLRPPHGSVAEQGCAVQPGSWYYPAGSTCQQVLGPLQGSLSAHCRPCLVSPP